MNRAKRSPVRRLSVALFLVLLAVLAVTVLAIDIATRRPQRLPRYASEVGPGLNFELVSEPGFDEAGCARLADSAWSMRYF